MLHVQVTCHIGLLSQIAIPVLRASMGCNSAVGTFDVDIAHVTSMYVCMYVYSMYVCMYVCMYIVCMLLISKCGRYHPECGLM